MIFLILRNFRKKELRRLRSTYGYDSYRGRSKTRTVLMALIVILLIVLILAVAAFFLLQDRVYYGDDGKAHIDLPSFLQRADAEPTPAPIQSQDIVIVTPEPSPEPTEQPLFYPVALPRSALTDGTAQAQMEAVGGNALLFDMKDDEGTLGYVSDLPQAISAGASAAAPGLNEAIRTLNGTEGLYTVARVACFRDNLAPKMNNTLALRSPIGNWRDREVVRWLSVEVAAARDYVSGVCRELAELGFDEILLDYAGFPTALDGDLDNLVVGERYDPTDRSSAVEAFYQQVRQALEDYPDVKVAVSVSAGLFAGEGDESGQSLELLGRYADRVYVPGPADAAAARAYETAQAELGEAFPLPVYTTSAYEQEPPTVSFTPVGGGSVLQSEA